jgi:multimeric flavodoxin WrbA
MKNEIPRRTFLGAALAAGAATGLAAESAATKPLKLLGIACSPRKGMTTAQAVQVALDAARAADPHLEVELIDLGGLRIAGWSPTLPEDDFAAILPKLQDPALAGLIMGSPCYFRSPSSLWKAFVERCMPLREPSTALAGKPIGAVAVGGSRQGGHELVIAHIHTTMMSFGMIPAGGQPPAYLGATVQPVKDDIAADAFGVESARKLGARVAELARKLGA